MRLHNLPTKIMLSVVFVIVGLVCIRTTFEVISNAKRLEELHKQVAGLETKQAVLTTQVEYAKSDDFVEREARNALNMVKPNERVYVAPLPLDRGPTSAPVESAGTNATSGAAPNRAELSDNLHPSSRTRTNYLDKWLALIF